MVTHSHKARNTLDGIQLLLLALIIVMGFLL